MKLSLTSLYVIVLLFAVSCIKTDLTFNRDIAPIIYNKCSSCHRDGGAAPFALTNYVQVNRKRNTILKVTQSGYMPPWPADRNYSHFLGEKFLTSEEKAMIKEWVRGGAPQGKGEEALMPVYSDLSRIGVPDTSFWFDSLFIEGDNKDKFYIMTLPIELAENTFVRAIEFVPNKNNLVHHMNGHLLNYEEGKKASVKQGLRVMNIETDEASYLRNFIALDLLNDDGSKPARIHSAVNYLPGVEASIYPEGIGGFTINKKAILVANDIHFGPIVKGKWDYSHVNLFYSKKPPERPIKETMMGTNGVSKIIPPLRIPANVISEHVSSLYVEDSISVLTINPHMHLLGKSFKAYALTANKDTIRLINIPKWDFRWQYFYTYPTMLVIPAGSTIYVEASFDNTIDNPNNPNYPPIEVAERLDRGGEGMRTTDEMLQFIISWLPYQQGDENISLEVND